MANGTFGYRLGDGAAGAVKIEGLSAVQRDLRGLRDDIDLVKTEFLATNRKVAEIVIEGSKKFVTVLSGALAASMRNASTKKAAKVRAGDKNDVPYAGPIHFGWPARRIKPQPFVYDAVDRRRSEIASTYERRLAELRTKYEL